MYALIGDLRSAVSAGSGSADSTVRTLNTLNAIVCPLLRVLYRRYTSLHKLSALCDVGKEKRGAFWKRLWLSCLMIL